MTNKINRREFLKYSGLMLAATGLSGCSWKGLAEGYELAQLAAVDTQAPNVLLIVLDTVRAQNLSLYGYDRPTTSTLERLAKSGTVFDRAISTAPWTLPSHASMFTGRWHHELSTQFTAPLDATYPTLAEVFRDRGYYTAGFVDNLGYCSYESGLHRGFVHYEDHPMSLQAFIASSSLSRTASENQTIRNAIDYHDLLKRKRAPEINASFLRWLSHHEDRPFFAFLNYYDAHTPYLPPEPFNTVFGPKEPRGNHDLTIDQWSKQEVQAEIDAYDGAIAYIDHQLNLLFEALKIRGVFDDTIIIITSDHGEQLGEHGLFDHINSLYIQTLHVPLVIIFPSRVPTDLRVSETVSLRDLPATIFELSRISDETRFPGNSLARYWQDQGKEEQKRSAGIILSELNAGFVKEAWYPVAKGNLKSLIEDRYHYIVNGDGGEEIYDLKNDPSELSDLANTIDGKTLNQFRASLESAIAHNKQLLI